MKRNEKKTAGKPKEEGEVTERKGARKEFRKLDYDRVCFRDCSMAVKKKGKKTRRGKSIRTLKSPLVRPLGK